MNSLRKLLGGRKQQTASEQDVVREQPLSATTPSREDTPPDGSKQQSTDQALGGIADELRRPVEQQMAILRFLCTCGKFDRDKVTTYFSMAEKVGMQWEPQDKHTMLNATLIALKLQSDGTVLDGFEQVRVMLIESRAEAVSKGLALFNQLLPTLPLDKATVAASASFLKQVGGEAKKLTRSFIH